MNTTLHLNIIRAKKSNSTQFASTLTLTSAVSAAQIWLRRLSLRDDPAAVRYAQNKYDQGRD